MHVALLEDEAEWQAIITAAISEAGWTSCSFRDAASLMAALPSGGFSALVVDAHLGEGQLDGRELVARLRAANRPEPILMLTQFAERYRASAVLDEGADDYLAKPFDPDELCARIRAIRRRRDSLNAQIISFGPLHLSRTFRCAHWYDQPVPLGVQSFDILLLLVEAGGELVSQAELWRRVWAKWSNLEPQVQPIQAGVYRLRKELRAVTVAELVTTVQGRGYRLVLDA